MMSVMSTHIGLYKEWRVGLCCHVELQLHHSFRQLTLFALQPLTVKWIMYKHYQVLTSCDYDIGLIFLWTGWIH